jgi:hypothetical protein
MAHQEWEVLSGPGRPRAPPTRLPGSAQAAERRRIELRDHLGQAIVVRGHPEAVRSILIAPGRSDGAVAHFRLPLPRLPALLMRAAFDLEYPLALRAS